MKVDQVVLVDEGNCGQGRVMQVVRGGFHKLHAFPGRASDRYRRVSGNMKTVIGHPQPARDGAERKDGAREQRDLRVHVAEGELNVGIGAGSQFAARLKPSGRSRLAEP
jgi:hypothetical protein